MGGLKERLSWVPEEIDALVALVLGFAFAVLGLLNVVHGDALAAATLAVLAVLAFAIVRERHSRQSFASAATQVRESLGRIEESVSTLLTGAQHRALTYEVHWDVVTSDGRLAEVQKHKKIHFLQNNVISLFDYVQADGRVSNTTYSPGKKADSFRVGSRLYDLISLGRVMRAGDEIDFTIERTVHDVFTDPDNSVTVQVIDPTDVVVLSLTWPEARPPSSVRVEQVIDERPTSRDIALDQLRHRQDGRTDFSQTVTAPPQGSSITVFWEW